MALILIKISRDPSVVSSPQPGVALPLTLIGRSLEDRIAHAMATALERALALANSGSFESVTEIYLELRKEGYSDSELVEILKTEMRAKLRAALGSVHSQH